VRKRTYSIDLFVESVGLAGLLGLGAEADKRSVAHGDAAPEALCGEGALDDMAAMTVGPSEMPTLQGLDSLIDTVAVPVEGALRNPSNVVGLERLSSAHPDEVKCKLVLDKTLRVAISVAKD
jgi:hypothetical protein